MPAYLLTWNPRQWHWEHLSEVAAGTADGDPFDMDWSTGNRKNVEVGDRLFLMRLGQTPKGIIAAGTATTTPQERDHWDGTEGKVAWYVNATFDRILDPAIDSPLDVLSITEGPLSRVNWSPQAGGVLIPEDAADLLEELWADHTGTIDRTTADILADQDADAFLKGRLMFRLHRLRERNKAVIEQAKKAAKAKSGRVTCSVCTFDFGAKYGDLGEDYIEGHHAKPVSELEEGAKTKASDIALVCANCHRMLHRKRPWLGVHELQALLK